MRKQGNKTKKEYVSQYDDASSSWPPVKSIRLKLLEAI